MDKEIWKDLIYQGVNYGMYLEISNTGKIRSKKNKTILKLCINKNGYYQVCASVGGRKHKKVFKLHKALAETFISNPNDYPVVNHIDGNKLNNDLSNLEWSTYSYNTRHAYSAGLIDTDKFSGVNAHCSKLTKEDVKFIRDSYKPRDKMLGARALARKFNIHHSNIVDIIHNRTYKNVA